MEVYQMGRGICRAVKVFAKFQVQKFFVITARVSKER